MPSITKGHMLVIGDTADKDNVLGIVCGWQDTRLVRFLSKAHSNNERPVPVSEKGGGVEALIKHLFVCLLQAHYSTYEILTNKTVL